MLESILRILSDSLDDTQIFAIDLEFNYLYFNNFHKVATKRAYGIDIRTGMNMLQHITDPGDRVKARDNFTRSFAGESHKTFEEYGTNYRTYFETTYIPVYENEGDIRASIAISRDVTDRIHSDEQFQMLFQKMLDGFALHEIISDKDGDPVDYRFLEVNPSFEKMTGLEREKILGKRVLQLIPDLEKSWIDIYGRVALTGEPVCFENYSSEMGKYFYVSAFRPAWNQFACIFTDITLQKEAEEALHNAQRLESIGVLAGGIAHDFNNLLSGIFGNIDLALLREERGLETREYLLRTIESLNKAKELTDKFLTFSRGGKPVRKPVDISSVVDRSGESILADSGLDYEFVSNTGTVMINGDENQLKQVFRNIMTNAKESVGEEGKIRVVINKSTDQDGIEFVKIDIEDNGCGIPENLQSKVFDPFYTTKDRASGLGLTTAHSIVLKHKGFMTLESSPGMGTAVSVNLPVG